MYKVKDDSKPGSSLSSVCPIPTLTKKYGSCNSMQKYQKMDGISDESKQGGYVGWSVFLFLKGMWTLINWSGWKTS